MASWLLGDGLGFFRLGVFGQLSGEGQTAGLWISRRDALVDVEDESVHYGQGF